MTAPHLYTFILDELVAVGDAQYDCRILLALPHRTGKTELSDWGLPRVSSYLRLLVCAELEDLLQQLAREGLVTTLLPGPAGDLIGDGWGTGQNYWLSWNLVLRSKLPPATTATLTNFLRGLLRERTDHLRRQLAADHIPENGHA